jgi:fibronectin-binding autotransporter adhesin
MKTLTRTLQTVAAVAAIFAMPHLASAAQKQFSVSVSPSVTNVLAGIATNVTVTVTDKSTAGSFVGSVTNSVIVSPSGQGVTASFSSSSSITVSNSASLVSGGSANLTLYIAATATATSNVVYTITVQGSNTAATGNSPIKGSASANYSFIFGNVPTMVWTPAGVDTNWSTAGNWSPSGPPGLNNDATFIDTGATTVGTVDNVVDNNFSIGSLTYGQTNLSHTTLIASSKTLTIGGDTVGLVADTRTDNGNAQVTVNTIKGAGGALVVTNTSASVKVGQSHSTANNLVSGAQGTLDMSGLDKFTATISRLLVGVDISIKGASGVLNLAKTNTITATVGSTAPQIDVGDNSQPQGSPAISSILSLGQTNAFFADSIGVGIGKGTGSMLFNSLFSAPSAYFRGTNGNTSRVGTWSIGDGFDERTFSASGTNDFSLGTVDALVDTMYVGKGASSGNGTLPDPGTGTLTFNAGTVNINTLEVGYGSLATGNLATGTGTVNANGGKLLVNTLLELAHDSGSSGTLNISNATVTANIGITAGGGTATINMNSAVLNATNNGVTIGTTANPLNTFSVTNATLNLAVASTPISTTPSVATTNLAAGGVANTINISSVPLVSGFPTQFPVIQYGFNGGSASGDLTTFTLGTLPSASPAYGAYISNNVANKSIDIVFTNGPFVAALTWDGTPTGNWDTTTTNWKPSIGPDTNYVQTDFVTFDDSLAGTANVNLTTTLLPGSLTVNNSASNYIFSGTGKISGTGGLSKQGAGTLVLDNSGLNDFSGGVIITGGTLQIGNNDANGNLPLGSVADNGALIFNRSDNITVMSTISGAGTITQNNTNVLILSGNNTFTGTATVAQGTLQVGSTNGLGLATNVTVNSGATFDVGGFALFGNGNSNLVVTVSGAGVGGNGAIINSGASQTKVLHTVTLAADATFGGTGDWDIHNTTGAAADAQLNGAFNLTKVGTNSITLQGVTIDGGLGDINVQAGGLTITATAAAPQNSLGNSSATATVFSNATLTLDSIGTIPSKNFVLTNGGTLKSSGTNTLGSSLTLAGAANNTISVGNGAQFTITSVISGTGSLSKNGANILFLTAANTYSGRTVVSSGTLALYGGSDGSIASSTNISITSGTTIDVSGRSDGTLTLTSGQTLVGGVGTNGPGTINGIFVANSGATVAPGAGSTNIGTLNVTSNLTLQGATVMKISATNGNDQIDAAAITYGGTLVVTNFSGAVTNGQSFQLFVATNGYSLTFSGGVTLPSAPGLTWTNTLTTNGRITAGVVSGPAAQPHITSVNLSGTSLVISGTNGTAGLQFVVLSSTNLALPFIQWTPVVTNTFTGGNFSVTNTVDPSAPQNFYILRVP